MAPHFPFVQEPGEHFLFEFIRRWQECGGHNLMTFIFKNNQITAVCDMFTYLRYIQLGLVKSGVQDVYWEVIRLRKQMTLARLGLS